MTLETSPKVIFGKGKEIRIDLWTTQGLGAATLCSVENPHVTFDFPQT